MAFFNRDLTAITPLTDWSAEVMLIHLEVLDKEIFSSAKKKFSLVPAPDKVDLMSWLHEHYPEACQTLRATEESWANAAISSFQHTCNLFRLYDLSEQTLKTVRLTESIDRMPASNEAEDTWVPPKLQEKVYTGKEAWTDKFNVKNFTLYNQPVVPLFLTNTAVWKTLYHCDGMWMVEDLLAYLDHHNIQAVGIKDKGVAPDLDMLRWKVVSEEVYTIDPPRTGEKRKRTRSVRALSPNP